MARLGGACFLATLGWLSLQAAASPCSSKGECAAGDRGSHRSSESLLVQLHQTTRRVATPLTAGSNVTLKVYRTGKRITAQPDGYVHAQWDNQGEWETLTVEKVGGQNGDEVYSGDVMLLRSSVGNRLTAKKNGDVHNEWDHTGEWQQFTIVKPGGGPVSDGDLVFFQAWTGSYIDADGEDQPGQVSARFAEMGEWQKLILEIRSPYSPPTDPPTTAATTASTTQTPAASTTTATVPEQTTTTQPATTTTPEREPTTTTPPSRLTVDVSLEWFHFQLVNELRAAGFTCPGGTVFAPNPTPLKFSCRLWCVAALHSKEMADNDYFGHTSVDGRSPWERAEEQGTTANAENIAAGNSSPEATLDQWKNSDGHCNNLMNPSSKAFAIGHATGGSYLNYWTQMLSYSSLIDDTSCYPDPSLVQVQRHREQSDVEVGSTVVLLGEPWSH